MLSGSTSSYRGTVVDHADGTYLAVYTVPRAGCVSERFADTAIYVPSAKHRSIGAFCFLCVGLSCYSRGLPYQAPPTSNGCMTCPSPRTLSTDSQHETTRPSQFVGVLTSWGLLRGYEGESCLLLRSVCPPSPPISSLCLSLSLTPSLSFSPPCLSLSRSPGRTPCE